MSAAMDPSAVRIMLAEDNPGDVLLFREALKNSAFPYELRVAEDGQKALAMVRRMAAGQDLPHPDLIVLDVNLPKHNGDEVLRQIRAEQALSHIPVIVLTSSAAPRDQALVHGLGVNRYIQKPSDLEQLLEIGKVIEDMLRR